MVASHAPLLRASEEDRPLLTQIDQLLAAGAGMAPVRLVLGEQAALLSPAVARLVGTVVHALAAGEALAVTGAATALTTRQAADLLDLSRRRLIGLLDRGELACTRVGRRRWVRLDDLLTYQSRRLADRDAALDRLVALSEELGLYDD